MNMMSIDEIIQRVTDICKENLLTVIIHSVNVRRI